VTIRMRSAGADELRLEVEDSGIGIRAEDLSRLFIEFQQLDASASKKYPGTGLGLALTKRIVEAQGGTVGVVSAPNRGSLFFAQLPRQALEPIAADHGPNGHAKGKTGNRAQVLVVDDDARDSDWLSAALGSAGYGVALAKTGGEALALLSSRHFDALILDLMLPDMSGWDVLRSTRVAGPNRSVPVVVVSVLADKGAGVGFAIQDFLEKPVSESDLLHAVRAGITARGGNGKHILLVDDDPADLKLYSTALKQHGYVTIAKSSATAALRIAAEKHPDLVVLDLVMPRVDGFEFLRRFRTTAAGLNVPVIVLTAKHLVQAEQELLASLAQGVVSKGDGSVQGLLAELDAALSGAGAHGEGAATDKT
jgi:DNA-binding response OmpR family regulator